MSARRAQHGATNEGWPLTSGNTCIRPWLIPEADASEQPSHVVDHHHVVGEALFVEVLHIPAADVELEAGSPFVIRVKHRNGITVASHWHSFDENITVISGTLRVRNGKITDHWGVGNLFSLMQQLGALKTWSDQ
jgi:anti-sigma factor ChrR (cupin superfamily)